jgi:hypothetical protein
MIDKILSDPELLIAAIAVFISFVSILIGAVSLSIQRTHNRKSVKPIANIILSDYENHISVNIANNGVGPLIIKTLNVTNQAGESKLNIIGWMPKHPDDLPWTSFAADITDFVIAPGDRLNLIDLKTTDEITSTFAAFRDHTRMALSNLKIELSYTDVYDSNLPSKVRALEWFGRSVSPGKGKKHG